ncbi:MAG: hypothetical protein OSB12_05720 [Planctomycetota bacterium]|jgi:hypothetical protein|nr:hypothetical protein [Planctomycetota bacterium]
MRIDSIGRWSLVPFGLSLVLWIFPLSLSTAIEAQPENREAQPENRSVVVEEAGHWRPGFELPLVGLTSSLLILSVLRAQQRLESRARQTF